MTKYTEYKVVASYQELWLSDGVKKSLEEGWAPLGGVALCSDSEDSIMYAQAMVK